MNHHQEKLGEQLKRLAAQLLNERALGQSLITVTGARFSDQGKKAFLRLSVWPEDKSGSALAFAERQLSDLRELVKTRVRTRDLPWLRFELDDQKEKE